MNPLPAILRHPPRHIPPVLAWICCLFFAGRLAAQIDLSIFDGTDVPETEAVAPGDAGEGGDPDPQAAREEELLVPEGPLVDAEDGGAEDGVEEDGGAEDGVEEDGGAEDGGDPMPPPGEESENNGRAEEAAEETTDVPGRATEVFRPTERIPADQSVDFPWDI